MQRTLIGLLGVLMIVAVPPPAHAAFPGLNGKIAYYTQPGTSDDIWVMQPDGSGNAPITGAPLHERHPAWSPDGSKIALMANGPNEDIYVMNADGTNMVNITNTSSNEGSPTWSPDGTKIAFSSTRTGDLGSKIYVMNADGSNVVRITNVDFVGDGDPAWSSDNHIAFVRQSHIFRMNADGSNVVQVTGSSTIDSQPNWSPSSDRIAYARSGSSPGTSGIHTINADGTNDVDLIAAMPDAHDPAWSPDATKIVATKSGHVWTMNANGTGADPAHDRPRDQRGAGLAAAALPRVCPAEGSDADPSFRWCPRTSNARRPTTRMGRRWRRPRATRSRHRRT